MMQEAPFTLTINGEEWRLATDPNRMLLDVLRDELDLTGAKYGCGLAQCGACSVLIDGIPARACVLRARHAAGHSITTLEGLGDKPTGTLHAVQQGFVEMQGAQCGYCTNGMIISAVALLDQNPSPSEDDIRAALRHNLCRCGTHTEIIASVMRAAQLMKA